MPETDPVLTEAFPAAAAVGTALERAGLTVAVAESCTGGLLGAALTAVAGSSAWVRGGVIAYANDVKVGLLGVPEDLLASHGAVSAETAAAMAVGVRQAAGADVGLAVTGVAGPGGGSVERPVGLVHVACSGPGSALRTAVVQGDRGREGNRSASVRAVLELCLEALAAR